MTTTATAAAAAAAEGREAVARARALEMCVALYTLGLLLALLQLSFRRWMAAERAAAWAAQHNHIERYHRELVRAAAAAGEAAQSAQELDGEMGGHAKELMVSELNRSRMVAVGQNFALAFAFRIGWLLLTIYDVAPTPEGKEVSCKDYHTLVSACNRIAQLLCFTAYTSLVGFWANTLRQHDQAKAARTNLQSEREIATALAQSTTRREAGATLVAVPSLSAARAETRPGDDINDQQGFNALCSVLSMILTPDIVQLLLNFWAYVLIMALLVVQWFECDNDRYDAIDRWQTITISMFFLVLGLMFLRYGLRLVALTRGIKRPVARRMMWNTLAVTVVSSTLILLRGALFLSEPLFQYTITGLAATILYPWFFYPVPELVPAVLMLHLMTPRPRKLRDPSSNQLVRSPLLGVQNGRGGTAAVALSSEDEELLLGAPSGPSSPGASFGSFSDDRDDADQIIDTSANDFWV